ncbi:hypothetical protein M432DRAFT_196762 [Thermoascus aurantiacus ATCC 26904]
MGCTAAGSELEAQKTTARGSRIALRGIPVTVFVERSRFLTSQARRAALSVLRSPPPHQAAPTLRCEGPRSSSSSPSLPASLRPHSLLSASPLSPLPPPRGANGPFRDGCRVGSRPQPTRLSLSDQGPAYRVFCASVSTRRRPFGCHLLVPSTVVFSHRTAPFFFPCPIDHGSLEIRYRECRSRGMHPRCSSAAPARFRPTSDEHDV